MPETAPAPLKVSVGELAVLYKEGSLGIHLSSTVRAREGLKAHQDWQEAQPGNYSAEVRIKRSIESPGGELMVQGRIDGVLIEENGAVIIEEIKSTRRPLESIEGPLPEHLAQNRIYAALYAANEEVDEITCRVRYIDLSKKESRAFDLHYSGKKLENFLQEAVGKFIALRRDQLDWLRKRNEALEKLEFPYPDKREGQTAFMRASYRAMLDGHRLFMEAPTGIGKTISAFLPALKALELGHAERIFFLTAKNSGKAVAEKTLHDLRQAGGNVRAVTITAKERFTCVPGEPCDPETCPGAKGYYGRLPDALDDACNEQAWTPEVIQAYAKKHNVCPFEFSLDLSERADVIICDYNYAFDPRVKFKRYFDEESGRHLFLVDECHNLVDRGRSMFSAEIDRQKVNELKNLLRQSDPMLHRALNAIDRELGNLSDDADGKEKVWEEAPDELELGVRQFIRAAEIWLGNSLNQDSREEMQRFYFEMQAFLQAADFYGDEHRCLYSQQDDSERIKLFCMDPARLLQKGLDQAISTIFFSATLHPADYYKNLLGGQLHDPQYALPSPFPPENLSLTIEPRIKTTYRARAQSYKILADKIVSFLREEEGHYLVFFPSYRYMADVLEFAEPKLDFAEVLVQEGKMSEKDQSEFLSYYKKPFSKTLVGFAVMGGSFAEGIDLTGEQLTGAVIIGAALPQVGLEQNLIREYFDAQGVNGFDYAYTYPGFTRVLQAVGRVIRTEEDRGRVLLVDHRFDSRLYRGLYPDHWQVMP